MFENLKKSLKKPTAEWIQEITDENEKLRAENSSIHGLQELLKLRLENIKTLQDENARLREQNDIAVHFVRWVIQWESDPDVKSLAQYMIDNAKLTLKEINKSTPPSQAENVSKNSVEIDR